MESVEVQSDTDDLAKLIEDDLQSNNMPDLLNNNLVIAGAGHTFEPEKKKIEELQKKTIDKSVKVKKIRDKLSRSRKKLKKTNDLIDMFNSIKSKHSISLKDITYQKQAQLLTSLLEFSDKWLAENERLCSDIRSLTKQLKNLGTEIQKKEASLLKTVYHLNFILATRKNVDTNRIYFYSNDSPDDSPFT